MDIDRSDFFKMGKGLIKDRLTIQFPGGLPVDKSKGIAVMQDMWKRYKTVSKFDASYWEGVVIRHDHGKEPLRASAL